MKSSVKCELQGWVDKSKSEMVYFEIQNLEGLR